MSWIVLSGNVHAFSLYGFKTHLCTKYFRSCILIVAKTLESLSGPTITYKLFRLTHRPMFTFSR